MVFLIYYLDKNKKLNWIIFLGGPFHHNEAGVTYLNASNNTNLQIGLYKFHTKDSFFFDSEGL